MSISSVVQLSIGNMWSHWGHFHDAPLVKISWSWPRSKQLTSMEHHALATWQISRLWLKAPPKSSVQLNSMKVAKVVLPPRSCPRHDGTFQKGFTPNTTCLRQLFSFKSESGSPMPAESLLLRWHWSTTCHHLQMKRTFGCLRSAEGSPTTLKYPLTILQLKSEQHHHAATLYFSITQPVTK